MASHVELFRAQELDDYLWPLRMENLFKTDDPKEALDDDVSEDVTDEENDADGGGDDEELNDSTNVEHEDDETIGEKN